MLPVTRWGFQPVATNTSFQHSVGTTVKSQTDMLKECLCKAGFSPCHFVRECLTGGFLRAVSHKSSVPYQFLLPETSGMASRSQVEVIGWDRLESPSVNILLTTKLLSLDPLSWDMDCLLTLWPLLIPCSLGNGCCTFGFLIFIIVERNFLYNSLYILRERSLKHICSIRAWVPVSFFLSLSLPSANSLERRNLSCSLSFPGFYDSLEKAPCTFTSPSRGHPVPSWETQVLCQGLYWFSA